jgi:Family of unknown function (DUF6159)
MFRSISRGWDIAAACWTVLKRYPKLAILPAFSAAALLAVLALFAITAGITGFHPPRHFAAGADHGAGGAYALLFALYFACSFAMIYFNAALVFCALQVFAGHEPSLRQGLATAAGRWPQILMWTLVATTVGILLQALTDYLRDRLGFLGGIAGFLGETAWSAATYFAVPVLVADGAGPVEAIKRSSAILREKWGTAVAGESGLGITAFVLTVPAILLAVFFASLGLVGIPLAAIAVLYLVAAALAFATLGTLFRTAVYVYATTGRAPVAIREDLIRDSFRNKR